jgi:hypothetical protein
VGSFAASHVLLRSAYASTVLFWRRLDPCLRRGDRKATTRRAVLPAGAAAGYTRGDVWRESMAERLNQECGHAGGDLDGLQ